MSSLNKLKAQSQKLKAKSQKLTAKSQKLKAKNSQLLDRTYKVYLRKDINRCKIGK